MDLNSSIMLSAKLHHFVLVTAGALQPKRHCRVGRSARDSARAPVASTRTGRVHRSRPRELVQYIVIMIICEKPLDVS